MKNKQQNPYAYGGCLVWVLVIMTILLFGCYSERKAASQVDKAKDHYEVMVAKKTRSWFPCVTLALDSSGFLSSIEGANDIIKAYDSALTVGQVRNEELEKLLSEKLAISPDTIYIECDKANKENKVLKQAVEKLKLAITNVKPIIKTVEDSACNRIAEDEKAKALQWKIKYETEKEIRQELQARIEGKVLIPWWIFIILSLGILVGLYLKFKKQIL